MPKVQVPMDVEMSDGRTLRVTIDQRDYAAVEAQDIAPASQRNIWTRYIAFSALARTGQYVGTWEAFNGRDCVEAISLPPGEGPAGDEDGLDPGRRAPGAGS